VGLFQRVYGELVLFHDRVATNFGKPGILRDFSEHGKLREF